MRAVALGIVLLVCASLAHADDARPRRLGVVVGLAVNVEPEQAAALAESLAQVLEEQFIVETVAGAEATRRLPAAGVPEECIGLPACIADLGARLSVDELLVLVIVRVGESLQLDASWVDVATAEVVPRPAVALAADGDARAAFVAAAGAMLPNATPRPSPAPVRAEVVADSSIIGTPEPSPPSSRHLSTGVWIAGGVGVAALTGGVGFGLTARSRHGRCEDEPCAESELDGLESRALAADLFFGAAAVSAAVAAVLYWRSDEAVEAPRVGLNFRPGGAVVGVGGQF